MSEREREGPAHLRLLREQRPGAHGAAAADHHLIPGRHQAPAQRAGEVARAQDAHHGHGRVGGRCLQRPGAHPSASDQRPLHLLTRHHKRSTSEQTNQFNFIEHCNTDHRALFVLHNQK